MRKIEMPSDVREYFASGAKTIKRVTANEDYTLTIHFNNDEIKLFDMNGMLYGVFEILKDRDKFKEVFIDEFGNIAWDIDTKLDSSIHWNNRIDLCTDSVYLGSKPL